MNTEAMVDRVEAACREVGLSSATIQSIKLARPSDLAAVSELIEDNRRMREELEHLQRQREQMMELLGSRNPEKILHDLRNMLNELTLLRALNERVGEE
jgi:hypothetical protein